MNSIILIVMMMVIGALIGGMTNSLAIKMLFRPYKTIFIGKYRLPFTPGLIPKRQKELARQLGQMVVDHLLTADGLRRKLENPAFQKQMTTWAQDEVEKLFQNPATLKEVLENVNLELSTEKIETTVSHWVEDRYHSVMGNYRDIPLQDLLTESWHHKAEEGTKQLADHIQYKIQSYLESSEGKGKVAALIENYLNDQGFLGNMISSFMGPDGITEKVHPAIIRYVSDQEMNTWLRSMLQSELKSLMNQRVDLIEAKIGKGTIAHTLGRAVAKALPLEEWLSRSVAEWGKPVQSKIIQDFVPILVTKLTALVSVRIDSMMQTMRLSEIVEEEVEAFQVERLEEMVLGISRNEFKMITFLGALLGGMIGLLQGIIVLFFG